MERGVSMTVIAHNLQAMNGMRILGQTDKSRADKAEKLSSGYRINRAADDAAGLSISEKLRWQIRGLNRAALNCQDGISLIQVTEGALDEVHDILQRMNELSVQAANDTNTTDDRSAIQREITALAREIDRISDDTNFNTRPVLKVPQLVETYSDINGISKMYKPYTAAGRRVYGNEIDFRKINSNNKAKLIGKEFVVKCSQNCGQIFNFKFTDADANSSVTTTYSGDKKNLFVEIGIENAALATGADVVQAILDEVRANQGVLGDPAYPNEDLIGHANGIMGSGSRLIMYSVSNGPKYVEGMGQIESGKLAETEYTLNLQVGALSKQAIGVTLKAINSGTLGVSDLKVNSFENAGKSMHAIQEGIETLSSYRSYLGAIQNRLEHTIDNNENISENSQSAESRIRDTDMADAMVDYSKDNILMQVSQSILAQTNQQSQGVLKLLQ